MKLNVIQVIWIAEDLDTGEIVCATPYFRDVIDFLWAASYLDENTPIITHENAPIGKVFGDRWLQAIKSFSAKKINSVLDWNISLRQVDLIELEREDK